jgi:tetratricopeptide (TPR) repeat protein
MELADSQSARLDGDAALTMLCAALAGLGRTAEAIQTCEEALDRHRETGYRIREARTLCSLGDAYLGAGDPAAARRHWDEARRIYTDIQSAEVGQISPLRMESQT